MVDELIRAFAEDKESESHFASFLDAFDSSVLATAEELRFHDGLDPDSLVEAQDHRLDERGQCTRSCLGAVDPTKSEAFFDLRLRREPANCRGRGHFPSRADRAQRCRFGYAFRSVPAHGGTAMKERRESEDRRLELRAEASGKISWFRRDGQEPLQGWLSDRSCSSFSFITAASTQPGMGEAIEVIGAFPMIRRGCVTRVAPYDESLSLVACRLHADDSPISLE